MRGSPTFEPPGRDRCARVRGQTSRWPGRIEGLLQRSASDDVRAAVGWLLTNGHVLACSQSETGTWYSHLVYSHGAFVKIHGVVQIIDRTALRDSHGFVSHATMTAIEGGLREFLELP